jgi:excisionase family DNA binding protein
LVLQVELSASQLAVVARMAADLLAERAQEPEPWLDAPAAARRLGYSDVKRGRRRVYDLAARGELPHGRDGRRVVFRGSDLDAYLAGGR